MAHLPKNAAIAEKYIADIDALLSTSSASSDREVDSPKEKSDWNSNWQKPSQIGKDVEKMQPQHRLEYLDGLRGFAALLVYILHYQNLTHSTTEDADLQRAFGGDGKYHMATLPGIRLLFTGGHFAVTTFFIISGYVLTSGPLRSLQAGNTTKLVDSVSSALFRRWFRLFIPCAVTTFFWMTSWHLFGVKTVHEHQTTYSGEIWHWYLDFKNYSFFFTDNYFSKYNFHLWSIPLEFRGSVLVYTAILAFRRLRNGTRLACEAALVFYFIYICDGWYCALFMMGMLLADIDLLKEQENLPETLTRLIPEQTWVYVLLMASSIYLGGVPSVSDNMDWLRTQPGWYWLSFLKPQAMYDGRWMFRFLASTFAMISIPRIRPLKSFFETDFCRYLGKISYAFYLIHGNVLFSLGDRLYAISGRIREHHALTAPGWQNYLALPGNGPLGMEANFLAPQLILLPFTLWLADIVTRLIDDPSVKFAQWLYRFVLVEDKVPVKRRADQIV